VKIHQYTVLACTGILAIASGSAAFAEQSAGSAAQPGASGNELEEIIVTARRKEENLQDVPQTINAVSGSNLQKLNILKYDDLDKVIAGLQLSSTGSFGASVSARGVTYQIQSSASSTVTQYLNDAPIVANAIFQSIYDVGQIEVLRGPQGTLRGTSSPSGSITFTTKRPDLNSFGGFADASVTNQDGRNLQGGVNLPLIPGKLAVRLAGMVDENNDGGIRSVNNRFDPQSRTESERITVRFEPTENVAANVMYQYMNRRDIGYGLGEFGPGGSGGPNAPANYNGPPLGQFDRLTAADLPSDNRNLIGILNGQFQWSFAGQQLTYVGSSTYYGLTTDGGGTGGANTLPGYISPAHNHTPDTSRSNELRLASVDRIAGMFDYVVGAIRVNTWAHPVLNNGVVALLPGFFGPPGAVPNPRVFNPRYQLSILIDVPTNTGETSEFANVTWHLGDKLEISGGLRRIAADTHSVSDIKLSNSFAAVPGTLLPAGPCAAFGGQFGVGYPGVCDFPVGGTQAVPFTDIAARESPWIYQGSVSYHLTPDLMVYANTGTAWRQGPYVVGITNINNAADLNALTFLHSEKSKSYEGGVKWLFLDHRGRLNVDYYHQTFDGLIYSSPFGVNYYTGSAVAAYNFNSNVPAKVDGIDVDFALEVTKQWSLSANVSWAQGKLSGAIPCNDSNFDGIPDTGIPPADGSTFKAAGTDVAYCKSNASTTSAPEWNANLQSEYDFHFIQDTNGFVRGLYSYLPKNPNASENFVTPAYGTLNLYLGVDSQTRSWEVSLYAKNLTNNQKIVFIGANQTQPYQSSTTLPLFGPSGYTAIGLTAPREVGLNFHFMFGSG
jgi:iron complex outermembrane receptor protein